MRVGLWTQLAGRWQMAGLGPNCWKSAGEVTALAARAASSLGLGRLAGTRVRSAIGRHQMRLNPMAPKTTPVGTEAATIDSSGEPHGESDDGDQQTPQDRPEVTVDQRPNDPHQPSPRNIL